MNARTARTHSKNVELLATFQLLVNAKLQQWDLEREIERILEGQFDRMDEALADFCSGCGATHTATDKDLRSYLEALQEDRN